MRIYPTVCGVGIFAWVGIAPILRATDHVIVHEWGTFTCLQDEQGQSIGGINVDDEPVPYFVASVAASVAPQYDSPHGWHNLGLAPYQLHKAWVSGDPHVTMRLETPVVYIYPPKGQAPQSVPPFDVHVDFHGGVLSQFYPHADFSGLPLRKFPQQPELDGKFPYVDETTGITGQTTTHLDWKGVHLGSTAQPIETDDKVWTTPREVNAPLLQIKYTVKDDQGTHDVTQAEHFLFYRGVGHLDSPLRLPSGNGDLGIWPQKRTDDVVYAHAWLARIKADGTCSFSELNPLDGSLRTELKPEPMATISEKFISTDFSSDNLTKLKASMQDALIKEGLFPDEASAMLRTWELSYFKSPGLRFFYIVPRAWVDQVLPLKITGAPTDIMRVMVGRIELITDEQKAALAQLSAVPCPNLAAFKKIAQHAVETSKLPPADIDAFYRGEKPLSDLGISIPPLIQDYLSLGRFRDALIVREQHLRPSINLAQFIKDNQLVPTQN